MKIAKIIKNMFIRTRQDSKATSTYITGVPDVTQAGEDGGVRHKRDQAHKPCNLLLESGNTQGQ